MLKRAASQMVLAINSSSSGEKFSHPTIAMADNTKSIAQAPTASTCALSALSYHYSASPYTHPIDKRCVGMLSQRRYLADNPGNVETRETSGFSIDSLPGGPERDDCRKPDHRMGIARRM